MKSSTSSCFYLADAVALTRSNDRLSQAAPTYPQSHAPSTFLQSCHKEDYVTVGSTQAISPTVTTLSLFPPVSCSGLKLFVKVSVFSTFSDLRCLLFSFDFFSPSLWRVLYLLGETFFHRAEEGLASIQLLTRTPYGCSCWAEVKGQNQSPARECTHANSLKEQGCEVLTSAGMPA